MNNLLNNQIKIDIQAAYGSFSSPDWSFVEKRYANHPYVILMERLTKIGNIQETTDINEDVSIVVFIEFDDCDSITVRLSLVGRYACISDTSGIFMSQDSLKHKIQLNDLLCILVENYVVYLQDEDLRQEIDFCSDFATVYEALFSADEAIGGS